MNSISLAEAAPATVAHGAKMETSIIETAASTPTSSLRSHFSNPAISNLTTNLVATTSTNCGITARTKEFQTPNSIRKVRNGTFHSLPIVNTPTPPSRYRKMDKIDNPFESYITERLHKPLIDRYGVRAYLERVAYLIWRIYAVCLLIVSCVVCSPSLFRAPATPQTCSGQWDGWNIDEISSLNPANIEAHETQFESSSDPKMEAKNQADIFTFFKETIIGKGRSSSPTRSILCTFFSLCFDSFSS